MEIPNLDPNLFVYTVEHDEPRLQPKVQRQIQVALGRVIRALPVDWVLLVGPTLSSTTTNTPLKVLIGVKDVFQTFTSYNNYADRIKDIEKDLNNGSFAIGTTHPIRYKLTTKDYKSLNINRAYVFMDDKWYFGEKRK